MDEDGYILVDFTEQLEQISSMGDQTFDLLNWVTQSNTKAWLDAAGFQGIPITDFTNDQIFTQFLLD